MRVQERLELLRRLLSLVVELRLRSVDHLRHEALHLSALLRRECCRAAAHHLVQRVDLQLQLLALGGRALLFVALELGQHGVAALRELVAQLDERMPQQLEVAPHQRVLHEEERVLEVLLHQRRAERLHTAVVMRHEPHTLRRLLQRTTHIRALTRRRRALWIQQKRLLQRLAEHCKHKRLTRSSSSSSSSGSRSRRSSSTAAAAACVWCRRRRRLRRHSVGVVVSAVGHLRDERATLR